MSRNIVKDYVDYNRKELIEYFNLIFNGKSFKGLANKMADIYTDLRYYNLYKHNDGTLINGIVNGVKEKTFAFISEENIKGDVKEEIYNALWIFV